MDITEFCSNKRSSLVDTWVNCFFSSYPLDSTGFMRTSRDRFANPVGETTRIAATLLFDAVIGKDTDSQSVKQALHDLIWIRAVQDMPPSKAVGALFLLKDLLRAEVLPECQKSEGYSINVLKEYLAMESRIDTLGLMALDMYSEARERVFRIRVDEVKRNQSQVIRLAKLRREQDGPAPETENRGVEE
jgi:hypothetical protein